MAKIYNKASDLEKQYKLYKRRSIISFIMMIVFLVLFSQVKEAFKITQIVLDAIGFLISSFSLSYNTKKAKSLYSGIMGENTTNEIISNLSDKYFAVSNVRVEFKGKSSELDLVVVGENGVFIIETKNHNGAINGNVEEREWTQYKTGRKGGKYSKKIYNPVKQVATHSYRLSNFLKEKKISVWVQGIVFFSNEDARVNLYGENNSKTPVFSMSDEGTIGLINYIKNYESKFLIDEKNKNKIKKLILK